MLDCWLTCHHLEECFDSISEAYDSIATYLESHQIDGVVPPTRARYSRARSYAAKARRQRGSCLWYRHQEPPPSELMSE